ncbi:MAG TPA: adenylate/guanylate cyclase domain-containing protein [Acidimicrobiia bacterium]|nr:adenylate/guanylate cyclase domain-containing protein [Acidimicrobiia bacterium]
MSRLTTWVAGFGAAPGDDDAARLEKATLTVVSLLIVPPAVVWGSVYLMVGRPLAALIPYSYVVVAIVALAFLHRTARIRVPRTVVLVTMTVLPFLLQWVLGGYAQSGAVSTWGLMVPALAVMFGAPVGRWVVAFIGLSVVSGLLDSRLADQFAPLPGGMARSFFVINAIAVGLTYFVGLRFFDSERTRARAVIQEQRERADALLLNVLPGEIAERLKAGERVIADELPAVSILFADIVGFTSTTAALPPERVVADLGEVFAAIDALVARHGLEKLKTIGDAYEVVAGAPIAREDHAEAIAELALDLMAGVAGMPLGESSVAFRIGIDTGRGVGAVIGTHKFTYDVWGDAVNTASRMESHGVPGRIQVTSRYRQLLDGRYRFESRGEIEVRGKGSMETWFLVGRVADESGA